MARQKASIQKQSAVPKSDPNKAKKRTQGLENSTLEQVHHIKEVGKQMHQQSKKTKKAYAGHVQRGRKWLQSIISGGNDDSESCYVRTEVHCVGWTSLLVSDGTEGNSLRVAKRIALANELERTRRVRGISRVALLGWLQSRLKMGIIPSPIQYIYK